MLHCVKLMLTTTFKEAAVSSAVSGALNLFSKDEIIVTPFPGQDSVENHSCFRAFLAVNGDIAQYFIHEFRNRIIEHNLRVVAKYYQRVSLARLQQLVSLSADDLESHLSELSFTGDLTLKIDRPSGIVSFKPLRSSEEILTEWSGDIAKMLNLMEATCHLINRENMVHKV